MNDTSNLPEPGMLAQAIEADIQALPDRKTATVRTVRQRYTRLVKKAEPTYLLALARVLKNRYGHHWVAEELIRFHLPTLHSLTEDDLEELGSGMDSWVRVDTFGTNLAGQAWRRGQVRDGVIHRWARSGDRWWRRAALVATVPLNIKAQGGQGDPPRTLAVCELLVADRDDMVVKALSWALRALAPRDPVAVEAFLDKHADQLAARVKREVRNKLRTGLKNP